MSYKAIDLFAGSGGLSLGLTWAGFNVVSAVEFDSLAAKTYRDNLGNHLIQKDINGLSVDELLDHAKLQPGECDLLAGGPPCQGFSTQRRGSDQDERNSLVLEFLRFIEGVKPKFFLMENVSGIMSKRGKGFLDKLLLQISDQGYIPHLHKIDAVNYGVPQFRKRVILIGEYAGVDRSSNYISPQQILSPERYRTVYDAISDLPSPPEDGSPHAFIPNHAREARLAPINLERIKHVPQGGGRLDLPEHLQLACHRNNPTHRHVDVYGRLSWNRPSGTITARFDSFTRGRFAHPVEHRSLTIREGARLQTFPDSFIFSGNRGECAKQIGNAVPPLLAMHLGEAILQGLKAGSQNHETGKDRYGIQQPLTL